MTNSKNFLSIFVDAASFVTPTDQSSIAEAKDTQQKAWEKISQQFTRQFPSTMNLLNPLGGVFLDDNDRPMITHSLHSGEGFTDEDSERFRSIVVNAYSDILGAQAQCLHVETDNQPPGSLFR